MHLKLTRYCRVIALSAALGLATPVHSGPIPLNTFLGFSFSTAGTPATGCVGGPKRAVLRLSSGTHHVPQRAAMDIPGTRRGSLR
jgi:hypothetical protein